MANVEPATAVRVTLARLLACCLYGDNSPLTVALLFNRPDFSPVWHRDTDTQHRQKLSPGQLGFSSRSHTQIQLRETR